MKILDLTSQRFYKKRHGNEKKKEKMDKGKGPK
jgi:hypothetical protein